MKFISLDNFVLHNLFDSTLPRYIYAPIAGMGHPEKRISKYLNTGKSGAKITNSLYGSRRISLQGKVYAATPAEYELQRRLLIGAAGDERDENGVLIYKKLSFTTMDDTQLYVEGTVASLIFDRNFLTHGRFFMDFDCADYRIYEDVLQSVSITAPVGSGAVYPVIYPVVYDPTTGGTAIAINSGTTETYPVIYLYGELDNPILINETTGYYVQLNMTVGENEVVEIHMEDEIVKSSIGEGLLDSLAEGSTFFYLKKGSNTIKLQTSSNENTGAALVKWRTALLGT